MINVESLDDLVSTTEAAKTCGLTVAAVSNWARRGHLKPSGLDERGRPLYRLIDVLRVARDTRQRALGRARTA